MGSKLPNGYIGANLESVSFAEKLIQEEERLAVAQRELTEKIHPKLPWRTYHHWRRGEREPAEWLQGLILEKLALCPTPQPKPKKQKTLKVELYLRVERNSKFVRGKKPSLEYIELFVLRQYRMKRLGKDTCRYELTIPYETEKELDETIEDILSEAERIADCRNCFTESDVVALDGSERQWG